MAVFSLTELDGNEQPTSDPVAEPIVLLPPGLMEQTTRLAPTVRRRIRRRVVAAAQAAAAAAKLTAVVREPGPQEYVPPPVETIEDLVRVPDISPAQDTTELDRQIHNFFSPAATDDMRAQGLLAVRAVARHNPSLVLNRGYLKHVLQWLHSRHKLLRPCAASALASLLGQRVGREAMLRNKDVLPRLVAMAKCGIYSLDAHYATLAISNWCLHPACKELLGQVGGVPVMVSLLKQAVSKPSAAQLGILRRAQLPPPPPDIKSKLLNPSEPPTLDPGPLLPQLSKVPLRTLSPASKVRPKIPDSELMWLEERPAAAQAVSALLSVAEVERNKRRMLAANLPGILQNCLCCTRSSSLLQRCRLLFTMLGLAELRHAVVSKVLDNRDTSPLPPISESCQQSDAIGEAEALDVAVQLGHLLNIKSEDHDLLVRKAEKRRKKAAKLQARTSLLHPRVSLKPTTSEQLTSPYLAHNPYHATSPLPHHPATSAELTGLRTAGSIAPRQSMLAGKPSTLTTRPSTLPTKPSTLASKASVAPPALLPGLPTRKSVALTAQASVARPLASTTAITLPPV